MSTPILHLIGLAKRAGKLEIGEEPVAAVARAKQAKLILLAEDAASNTSRRAATFGQIGNVLQISLPYSKSELGFSLGRSEISMIALTDAGFAGAIGDKLVALDEKKYGAAGAQLRAKADRTYARQKEKRQHEKNLQRGKGKPWAVPQVVKDEKKKKQQVSENARNKSPNFKRKNSHQEIFHDDNRKNKHPNATAKNSPGNRSSQSSEKRSSKGRDAQPYHSTPKPIKGQRIVIKGKFHSSKSTKP